MNFLSNRAMTCQVPTLKKFLCCLQLETGGLIVGWYTAILSGLLAFMVTGLMIMDIIYEKEHQLTLPNYLQLGPTGKLMKKF